MANKELLSKFAELQPLPGSQIAFVTCPLFEVLYEGTRGPGKTFSLFFDFAQHIGKGFGPAWKGILFRRNYPDLEDIIAKGHKFFPLIFPGATYKGGEKGKWTFPDGEELLFRYMDVPQTYWKYHGHEYPWVGWDELTTWPSDECYEIMKSCCRSPFPGIPKKYRATANPYGPGHNWVKSYWRISEINPGRVIVRRWRDPITGKNLDHKRTHIHGNIFENKFLLQNDPQYLNNLKAEKNPARKRAWLHGDWSIVAGGAIDDLWDEDVHLIHPFSIPHTWYVDRSFDWGSSKPFSIGWWAESDGSTVRVLNKKRNKYEMRSYPPGTLFRIAEWYGWNGRANQGCLMSPTNIAKRLKEAEENLPYVVHPGPADTQIFTSNDDRTRTIAHEMSLLGIAWREANKAPGTRKQGLELFRSRLEASLVYPMEEPGIFIFDTCYHFRRTMPVLPRDPKDMDDVDTEAEDHIWDETRYRILHKRIKGGMVKTSGV